MSRDGENHQQPPPPLSSSAAMAVGFSLVTLMASSVTTVVKLVFFPSNDPSPLLFKLLMKLGEMCGTSLVLNLRCQLPTEDLDALVSITSDEDIANLIEDYDRVAPPPAPPSLKIRAFLSAPKTTKKVSPPPSTASPKSSYFAATMLPPRCPKPIGGGPFFRHVLRPLVYPQPAAEIPQYAYINGGHRNSCNVRLIHSGRHWQ
ncbi:Octicosapeptide/Phox/Bem1p family protein [Abeliophyllum distichum]|uniref:Octicosapeptide/Phox/Bem1p family protein n=1 Tax=Abeliophyllum distichum TaxID=126358 RepID=A0ABD1W003_9LAMI